MAYSIWRTGHRLDDCLYNAAYQFEFFQAVRLVLLAESVTGRQEVRPLNDVLRFRAHASMAFPPSPVVTLTRRRTTAATNKEDPQTLEPDRQQDKQQPLLEMTVAFLGLIGPSRVLPDSYTELALRQQSFGDDSFADFFNVFHHRLLMLYYRAWEKHQFAIGQEQARHSKDAVTGYLLNLIGMGTAGLSDRLPFADLVLLRYAGLVAQRPRSTECLRAMLSDYLGICVKVEQFRGRWHVLDEDQLTVLGSGTLSSRLGEGAAAGDMVWTLQSLIRIVLGPLSADQFFELLPEGARFGEVNGLVRWYLGPATEFELQPVLQKNVTPAWGALGRVSSTGGGRTMRLGWSGWLTDQAFAEPAADAVFAEHERVAMEGDWG